MGKKSLQLQAAVNNNSLIMRGRKLQRETITTVPLNRTGLILLVESADLSLSVSLSQVKPAMTFARASLSTTTQGFHVRRIVLF